MLILGRKAGERIFIGSEIEIIILGVDHGGRIRIGIQAPREIDIWREDAARDFKPVVARRGRST